MTADLFEPWLTRFNNRVRAERRHIILLVDNAASHKVTTKLSNIKLHFLPPNTTSHIQPMDAGIIRCFKAHYRKQLLRHYISQLEDNLPTTVNLREAISFVRDGWKAVSQQTIQNCWRHTKILPPAPTPEPDQSEDPVPDPVIAEVNSLLQKMPEADLTADQYLSIDDTAETGDILEDTDILDIVNPSCTTSTADDSDGEDEPLIPPVSSKSARESLATLLRYCEETPNCLDYINPLTCLSDKINSNSTSQTRQLTIQEFFTTSHDKD
jgi:hypothetical protein